MHTTAAAYAVVQQGMTIKLKVLPRPGATSAPGFGPDSPPPADAPAAAAPNASTTPPEAGASGAGALISTNEA
eukprot:scaffold217109_cov13-Tisochrysis_lutea.AAC.1